MLSCGGEIMLLKVFLMKFSSVATQTEATEQYFLVVLFILRYKVVPSFRSVNELLMCDHLIEEVRRSLFCHTAWVQLLNLWTKFLFDLSK